MISSPLPLPATPPPLAPPPAANAAPPAPGETGEQNPGGFARLLDQAREQPADASAAAPGGDAGADKTARARTPRAGQARPAAPETEAAADAPPSSRDPGDDTEVSVGAAEVPADKAAPRSANNTDTAVLLASLAAFARPQPAPAEPPAKAARTAGDEGPGWFRPQGRALPRLQPAGAPETTQAAGRPAAGNVAAAADPGAAAAAASLTTASRGGAEADAAATAASRSFAAELQATLAAPAPAQPAAAAAAANNAAAAAPAAPAQLAASPGSPGFAPELGATLATFVREGVHHARLELNPAEMGPLTVQIQLDGQAAQVHLAAQNADTRQALEQAMPQLAGSLREAGLTLSGGGVFEQPRQPQPQGTPGDSRSVGADGEHDDQLGSHAQQPAAPLRRRGVVDLVA